MTFARNAAFIVCSGQYICAENGGGSYLVANRETPLAWETFTLEVLRDDTGGVRNGFPSGCQVALKSANGDYVCADRNLGWSLYANRIDLGNWEKFYMEEVDGNNEIHSGSRVALKSFEKDENGRYRYVCAEHGGGNGLIANRYEIKAWETFILELDEWIRQRPILYEHANYTGASQGLSPGVYDYPMRIGNDKVSSIRMLGKRARIRLYEYPNFKGQEKLYSYTQDYPTLEDFNDKTSSAIVGNLGIGANYTDLGCDESGSFDYASLWKDPLSIRDGMRLLSRHIDRGLKGFGLRCINGLRVWVDPPYFNGNPGAYSDDFARDRISMIAQRAGYNITVDLFDFAFPGRRVHEAPYSMKDPVFNKSYSDILLKRIVKIVIPNKDHPNITWSIGNEPHGPSNPLLFALWYKSWAKVLAQNMGRGQKISIEITPGAAQHNWQNPINTLGAARIIIRNSDIVSVHFYTDMNYIDNEINSMKQWQRLSGDKFRIGEFSVPKTTADRRKVFVSWLGGLRPNEPLGGFEAMGLRGVRSLLIWQFLKSEAGGHIDDRSVEIPEDPNYGNFDTGNEIANYLQEFGWLVMVR